MPRILKNNIFTVELLIAALIGMIVTTIVAVSVIDRMEKHIEEIRNNQISNSDRARIQRQHLESKIDSFIIFQEHQQLVRRQLK